MTAIAMSQMGATNCGSVIEDNGFDLWCGEDTLCKWKLERGRIEQVPTWHDGDYGVSFVGSDTAIEQLSPVTNRDGNCLVFSMIANVETNAEVYLDVDIEGDGTVERMERIPTSNWKPLTYAIRIAPPFDGIRFELAKTGGGAAVLAQLKGEIGGAECNGLEPIVATKRADGGACDVDSECLSGLCRAMFFASSSDTGHYCVGCTETSCGATDVCGAGEPQFSTLAVPLECVPRSAKELGELCYAHGECASGICAGGMCSACSPDDNHGTCADGRACASAVWPGGIPGLYEPYVCGPGLGTSGPGVACASDADCASGRCNGSVREQCSDGRACETAATCATGTCTTVGIQGGSCQ